MSKPRHCLRPRPRPLTQSLARCPRQPDLGFYVHSEYFSIPGITSILRGSHARGRLLTDILGNSNSLGFACRGVDWFPRVYPLLKLTADIHFVRRGMGWVLRNPKPKPNRLWAGLGSVIKIRTQPNWFLVGLGYHWVTQQKKSASVNYDY